jgi:hypothetical protein
MSSDKPSNALAYAAQRAVQHEFFLAGILHEYQQANQLDDDGLAKFLGCHINDLSRLALCRRPVPEQKAFMRDIEHLAQRFHLNGDQLAIIVRQVNSLRALRQQLTSNRKAQQIEGILRAARDRDPDSVDALEDSDD